MHDHAKKLKVFRFLISWLHVDWCFECRMLKRSVLFIAINVLWNETSSGLMDFGKYFKFHFSQLMSLDHAHKIIWHCLDLSQPVFRWWALNTLWCHNQAAVCGLRWERIHGRTTELQVSFSSNSVECFSVGFPLKSITTKMFCKIKIWKLSHVNMTHWADQDSHCLKIDFTQTSVSLFDYFFSWFSTRQKNNNNFLPQRFHDVIIKCLYFTSWRLYSVFTLSERLHWPSHHTLWSQLLQDLPERTLGQEWPVPLPHVSQKIPCEAWDLHQHGHRRDYGPNKKEESYNTWKRWCTVAGDVWRVHRNGA